MDVPISNKIHKQQSFVIGKRVLVQKPSDLGHPLVSIDAKQEGSEKANVPEH